VSEVLRALSSPTRLKVLELLCKGLEYPEQFAEELGVSRVAAYEHLMKLVKLGLAYRVSKEGRYAYRPTQWGLEVYDALSRGFKPPTPPTVPQPREGRRVRISSKTAVPLIILAIGGLAFVVGVYHGKVLGGIAWLLIACFVALVARLVLR